jgi:hypothetical protein
MPDTIPNDDDDDEDYDGEDAGSLTSHRQQWRNASQLCTLSSPSTDRLVSRTTSEPGQALVQGPSWQGPPARTFGVHLGRGRDNECASDRCASPQHRDSWAWDSSFRARVGDMALFEVYSRVSAGRRIGSRPHTVAHNITEPANPAGPDAWGPKCLRLPFRLGLNPPDATGPTATWECWRAGWLVCNYVREATIILIPWFAMMR